jgi:hypothetical protein
MVIAQYATWSVLSEQPVIWNLNAAHCQNHKAAFTQLVYLTNICHLKELSLLFNWRRRLSLRSHNWFILDKQSTGLCGEYRSVLRLSKYTVQVSECIATVQVHGPGIAALELLTFETKFNPLKPSGYFVYRTVVTLCIAQWLLYVPHSGYFVYRTVVTLCTAQWLLYVRHSGYFVYHQV